jgi:phosphoribosylformimino-5-aminoimidazole carboxamide ribotide isomerase
MALVVPCIDIQGGKVVQLVQGVRKALEGPSPDEMLERFAAFPEIQIIDLDAAMGVGDNAALIERITSMAPQCRVGGGVRTPERAARLRELGAHRVIVGTAAFTPVFDDIVAAVGAEHLMVALDSKDGRVVVDGWATTLATSSEDAVQQFTDRCAGFLCTYVDKEGMLEGTNIDWFASLRRATALSITAAGGVTTLAEVQALLRLNLDVAIGMAVYTGLLDLDALLRLCAGSE